MTLRERLSKALMDLRETLKSGEISPLSLNFRNLETERAWRQSKSNNQKRLYVLLFTSYLILSYSLFTVESYRDEFNLWRTIIPRIIVTFVILLGYLIIKRRPNHTENLLASLIMFMGAWLLEKKRSDDIFWNINTPYSAGTQIEFLLTTLIIAKINWMKNFFIILVINISASFCFMPSQESTNDNTFFLINATLNTLLLCGVSFTTERTFRTLFDQLRKRENSLINFQHLIKNFLPNPVIIMHGKNILFENNEALSAFCSSSRMELNRHLENLVIETAKYENTSSYTCNTENEGEADPLRKFSNNCEDFFSEKLRAFETLEINEKISLFNMLESTTEFQRPNVNFSIKLRSRLKTKNNLLCIKFDIQAKNIIWNDKSAVVLVITENKSHQKIKELKDIASCKDKLLASFSHNLRTPLNGVIGMISEALGISLESTVKESLNIALNSSKHLLSMINDILDLYQLTNGSLRLSLEYFSLWDLIREATSIIEDKVKLKGLHITNENKTFLDTSKLIIKSDKSRLRQVMLNLLTNAVKYTEKGSISISIEFVNILTESNRTKNSCYYLIKVIDTGCGIKESEKNGLFKLFGKMGSSAPDKLEVKNDTGVGLGLSISQKIVKILNNNREEGEIKIESEVGRGSCFSFPLLIKMDEESDENFLTFSEILVKEIYKSGNKISKYKGTHTSLEDQIRYQIKILVVDDDPINILVASSYLKSSKYKLDVAFNGLEALKIINSRAEEKYFYDIILMDCNMPFMSGPEASQKIKQMIELHSIKDLPIIACSANVSEEDYADCISSGMCDFISKPFTKRDLIARLNKHIGKKFPKIFSDLENVE